jgi:hypothetical protein
MTVRYPTALQRLHGFKCHDVDIRKGEEMLGADHTSNAYCQFAFPSQASLLKTIAEYVLLDLLLDPDYSDTCNHKPRLPPASNS